jgi:hypothetical protein
MGIVNYLYELAGVSVEVRQALNDEADRYVSEVLEDFSSESEEERSASDLTKFNEGVRSVTTPDCMTTWDEYRNGEDNTTPEGQPLRIDNILDIDDIALILGAMDLRFYLKEEDEKLKKELIKRELI